jgi:hypothetical protein
MGNYQDLRASHRCLATNQQLCDYSIATLIKCLKDQPKISKNSCAAIEKLALPDVWLLILQRLTRLYCDLVLTLGAQNNSC